MSFVAHQSHIAQRLINSIQSLPLWVKQVIYVKLHQELCVHFSQSTLLDIGLEDTVAFYVPTLTPEGERSLLNIKNEMLNKLMMSAKDKLTLLDICLRNAWPLETVCQQLVEAMKQQWIFPPSSLKAIGTIEYLGNSIRLGEYLVKMGRLTIEQLEQALRTQQYIKEAMQEHTGLANILINLGYITRQDTEGILFLKEESRQPMDNIAIFEKLMN
jgi:hypothetical protein